MTFGIFLRNMHRWSAHGMVAVVFLHMCRVFFTGLYKTPREFNWVIGCRAAAADAVLSFTGYLLPWDQLAFWAITVGTNIAAYAPLVGDQIKFLLLGGPRVGQRRCCASTCCTASCCRSRAVLIAVHFWRVRKDG